jgi:hypothetical protein
LQRWIQGSLHSQWLKLAVLKANFTDETADCPNPRSHGHAYRPASPGFRGSTWSPYRSDVWGDYRGTWGLIWGPATGSRVPRSADNTGVVATAVEQLPFLHYTRTRQGIRQQEERQRHGTAAIPQRGPQAEPRAGIRVANRLVFNQNS